MSYAHDPWTSPEEPYTQGPIMGGVKAKPTTTPAPRRWRDLKLSVRLANELSQYDNLQTLEEIAQYKKSDLLRFSTLGRRTADELEGLLSAAGLRFADEN